MFVPTDTKFLPSRVVYGSIDEFGYQPVNIEIPGVGVLICEHYPSNDPNLANIMDFGFDWHETAYAVLFGKQGQSSNPTPETSLPYDWDQDGAA